MEGLFSKKQQKKKKKDKNNGEETAAKALKYDKGTIKEEASKPNLANDDVELTVFADGATKEQAIQAALRSAIEQTFGTFVSSHTEILNDSLVKDEIATVASGNIKSYECLSESYSENKCVVCVKTMVSINNLVNYTQSKGGETELAGATFAMNMKMRQFNKKNEEIALNHLFDEIKALAPYAFDYRINAEEPIETGDGNCKFSICVTARANQNMKAIYNVFHNTLTALSLTPQEISEYRKRNVEFYSYEFYSIDWSEMVFFGRYKNEYAEMLINLLEQKKRNVENGHIVDAEACLRSINLYMNSLKSDSNAPLSVLDGTSYKRNINNLAYKAREELNEKLDCYNYAGIYHFRNSLSDFLRKVDNLLIRSAFDFQIQDGINTYKLDIETDDVINIGNGKVISTVCLTPLFKKNDANGYGSISGLLADPMLVDAYKFQIVFKLTLDEIAKVKGFKAEPLHSIE